MSQQPDGSFVCDRCGADVANGGVASSIIITDVVADDRGGLRRLHLCRDRTAGEGEQAVQVAGCGRGLHDYITGGQDNRQDNRQDSRQGDRQ